MMNDDEIKKLYAEMVNEYGNKLPNQIGRAHV